MVRKYSGVWVAGANEDTDIAFGYAAESYIDFGVPMMFLPVFIWGTFMGVCYAGMFKYFRHRDIAVSVTTVICWLTLYLFERSWTKTIGLGGTLMIYVGTLSFVLDRLWFEKFATPTSRAGGRRGGTRRRPVASLPAALEVNIWNGAPVLYALSAGLSRRGHRRPRRARASRVSRIGPPKPESRSVSCTARRQRCSAACWPSEGWSRDRSTSAGEARVSFERLVAKRELARHPRGRAVLLREWSHDAARHWTAPIDFLFIDGDHSWSRHRTRLAGLAAASGPRRGRRATRQPSNAGPRPVGQRPVHERRGPARSAVCCR
jgi:hypothetical protein